MITSSNSLLNPHQSGFTKYHSTETLLVSLYNKLVSAVSPQQVSCLCLCLDIAAAFDTIDHTILLQRLSSWFGVSGTALLWFQSYRSFSVKACSHSSQLEVCGYNICATRPVPVPHNVPRTRTRPVLKIS